MNYRHEWFVLLLLLCKRPQWLSLLACLLTDKGHTVVCTGRARLQADNVDARDELCFGDGASNLPCLLHLLCFLSFYGNVDISESNDIGCSDHQEARVELGNGDQARASRWGYFTRTYWLCLCAELRTMYCVLIMYAIICRAKCI